MRVSACRFLLSTTAAVTVCLAAPAAAQSYGSFGDNIADPGNIPPILEEGNQQNGTNDDTNFPPSPPNAGNRFSNGPTAAELLPQILQREFDDVQNNAVGNAFSDKLPVSLAGGILLGNGSSIPGPIGRGLFALNDTDVATQVDNYLARTGPLGSADLMLLYASGNDGALALNTVALTNPPQDQALQIIVSGAQVNGANTAASAAKLNAAGAGTVLVSNLPNIGQTPAARAGGLSGQQLATLFAQTTNDALVGALSTVDPGQGTIIIADSFALTNDIATNPGKYGFADVTNPCSLAPTCVNAGRDVQDQFLFWDVFFPTARGHEISAQFLADTVNAPRTIPALAEQARFGTQMHATDLLGRTGEDGFWVEAAGSWQRYRRAATPFAAGYQADGPRADLVLGWSGPLGLTAGVALGYSDMDVDFRDVAGGFDRRTINLGAFASIETPIVNFAAAASLGFDDFDNLARDTDVAGQISSGETDGDSFAIVGEISRDFGFGDLVKITPLARIGYARSEVDGFAEAGATGLSQIVADQRLSKTYSEFGARAGVEFAGVSASLTGIYHFRLNGGTQTVRTSLVSMPNFQRRAFVRAADRDYALVDAELVIPVGSNAKIGASGEATFADNDFSYLTGTVFLRFGF